MPQLELGAMGRTDPEGRNPPVKTESRDKMNQAHNSVQEDDLDSGKEVLPRGQAAAKLWNRWFSLCQWDRQEDEMGGSTERVFFLGPVCNVEPGERLELRVEWCKEAGTPGYHLRLDTAKRVLIDLLKTNQADIEKKLAEGGIPNAIKMRREWTSILKSLLVETQPGQRAELWRQTSRVLDNWQRTNIPGYDSRHALLDALVSGASRNLDSARFV